MKERNLIPLGAVINLNEPDVEVFPVYQHIILRNFWEYYLGKPDENGIAYGFVMGIENEWGDVDVNEIMPYLTSIARGRELEFVMPPTGYQWEDEL